MNKFFAFAGEAQVSSGNVDGEDHFEQASQAVQSSALQSRPGREQNGEDREEDRPHQSADQRYQGESI